MNLEMDNRSAERMIHGAQLDREVKAWQKDGVWGNTVAWLQATYYSNKSEAFVANMAKGAIATLKRENPNLSDDLLALNIKTFVENKDRILSDFPGGYSESKWSDSEGKPISEKEAFDGLALKDKLKMAMWGGQEYRDVQEARLQLEAKSKLSQVAEIVRYEQKNAPLDAIARALQTLKSAPEKTRGWIESAWKKLTRPENRKGLIMDAAVVGLCGVAIVALLNSGGFGREGYADEMVVAPAAPVARQLEKMTETPFAAINDVAPSAVATESRGSVTKNTIRVEVVNITQLKEWSIGEVGFDLTIPFSMTIPAETLSAVAIGGTDAHIGLNPALEDQVIFRQDIADRFAQWGVGENRNLADVVRTHVDGLYAIGFHSGYDKYGAMPGQFMDVDNPDSLIGNTIKITRDGKEITLKFTAVKRVDADLVGAGGAAVADGSSTVPTAHIRLTELGFSEEDYKNADLVLFTCGKDGTGTFGERVFALLEVVEEDGAVEIANKMAPVGE